MQPWSPAFLQDAVRWSSRAVLTRNLWARTPWFSVSIFFFFFSPSTYLCGKISAFITDNLFRLPSGCSMLTLKELDLDCGGRRGAFKNLNLCFMARKVCVCGCFFFFSWKCDDDPERGRLARFETARALPCGPCCGHSMRGACALSTPTLFSQEMNKGSGFWGS